MYKHCYKSKYGNSIKICLHIMMYLHKYEIIIVVEVPWPILKRDSVTFTYVNMMCSVPLNLYW